MPPGLRPFPACIQLLRLGRLPVLVDRPSQPSPAWDFPQLLVAGAGRVFGPPLSAAISPRRLPAHACPSFPDLAANAALAVVALSLRPDSSRSRRSKPPREDSRVEVLSGCTRSRRVPATL